MEYKDYYKTLGIKRDADKAEIKKAYRKLARKYHPDVSDETDAESRFKDVSEAYNVLKDDEKRASYDELGNHWQAGQDFHTPPGWQQSHSGFGQNSQYEDFYSTHSQGGGPDVSDFFESLFGHRGGYYEPAQQAASTDQHASVQIELADAFTGASRALSLSEPVVTQSGHLQNKPRTLNVKIPKGILQGQTMRLKGQGLASPDGGQRGDLFLEVNFAPHPVYSIDGKDISLELPVAPWEAALGAKVAVPLPDGNSVSLTLQPGSSSGKKMRLKGKGIPSKVPGNLVVKLKIVVPGSISEAQRNAYEALKKASDFDARQTLRQRLNQ